MPSPERTDNEVTKITPPASEMSDNFIQVVLKHVHETLEHGGDSRSC